MKRLLSFFYFNGKQEERATGAVKIVFLIFYTLAWQYLATCGFK